MARAASQSPITPGIGPLGTDEAGGIGAELEGVGVGVDLHVDQAGVVAEFQLVQGPGLESWDEQLPDPAAAAGAHGVDPPVPGVEVPHHAGAGGVGGPDGELDPVHPLDTARVGAEEAIGVPVPALAEEVQVEVLRLGWETIGVVVPVAVTGAVLPLQGIALRDPGPIALPDEEVGPIDPLQARTAVRQADRLRLRQIDPHHDPGLGDVAPEEREGVMVAGLEDGPQRFRVALEARRGLRGRRGRDRRGGLIRGLWSRGCGWTWRPGSCESKPGGWPRVAWIRQPGGAVRQGGRAGRTHEVGESP